MNCLKTSENFVKKKRKDYGHMEYAPFYFNSAPKAVINFDKYNLHKLLQEFLHMTGNWLSN